YSTLFRSPGVDRTLAGQGTEALEPGLDRDAGAEPHDLGQGAPQQHPHRDRQHGHDAEEQEGEARREALVPGNGGGRLQGVGDHGAPRAARRAPPPRRACGCASGVTVYQSLAESEERRHRDARAAALQASRSTSPSRRAKSAACVRLRRPSLARRLETCDFTVASATSSRWAMALFVMPFATSDSTSDSRSVRGSRSLGPRTSRTRRAWARGSRRTSPLAAALTASNSSPGRDSLSM